MPHQGTLGLSSTPEVSEQVPTPGLTVLCLGVHGAAFWL